MFGLIFEDSVFSISINQHQDTTVSAHILMLPLHVPMWTAHTHMHCFSFTAVYTPRTNSSLFKGSLVMTWTILLKYLVSASLAGHTENQIVNSENPSLFQLKQSKTLSTEGQKYKYSKPTWFSYPNTQCVWWCENPKGLAFLSNTYLSQKGNWKKKTKHKKTPNTKNIPRPAKSK